MKEIIVKWSMKENSYFLFEIIIGYMINIHDIAIKFNNSDN